MKKVLSMVAALLLCVGTQAQIVSSRSAIVKTEKQASSTQWFLRAGLNIMNFSGDGGEGADSNIGYNATFWLSEAFRQYRRILGDGVWTWLPWFQSGRHEMYGSQHTIFSVHIRMEICCGGQRPYRPACRSLR